MYFLLSRPTGITGNDSKLRKQDAERRHSPKTGMLVARRQPVARNRVEFGDQEKASASLYTVDHLHDRIDAGSNTTARTPQSVDRVQIEQQSRLTRQVV